jgi:hypothetical protein
VTVIGTLMKRTTMEIALDTTPNAVAERKPFELPLIQTSESSSTTQEDRLASRRKYSKSATKEQTTQAADGTLDKSHAFLLLDNMALIFWFFNKARPNKIHSFLSGHPLHACSKRNRYPGVSKRQSAKSFPLSCLFFMKNSKSHRTCFTFSTLTQPDLFTTFVRL